MKARILSKCLVIMLATCGGAVAQDLIQPQKAHGNWIGVWQGQLDGQPGVTITLADDRGRLGGTIVFNIIVRLPQPHVIASQPQMLLSPTPDGDTLHFKVDAFQGRPNLEYDLKATGDGAAHLRCLNCAGAPEADLVRAPATPEGQ